MHKTILEGRERARGAGESRRHRITCRRFTFRVSSISGSTSSHPQRRAFGSVLAKAPNDVAVRARIGGPLREARQNRPGTRDTGAGAARHAK